MNISVIGLGKLGSPLVAVLAQSGHRVVGVDTNASFVKALNQGLPPVQEPNLVEFITNNINRITATQDYQTAINDSDLTFIIVPTPSLSSGLFNLDYVLEVCSVLGVCIANKKAPHTVVLVSTVIPGDCKKYIVPALEKSSGLKCGVDFGFCYSPEFIALGSVIRDLRNPDMLLIGESDPCSGAIVEEVLTSMTVNSPRIIRTNWVNAELIKLSVNTFVTTKISYTNMISEVCEHFSGADAAVVTDALGADSRIGKKYLNVGLGFGGPCFPRDNRAFTRMASYVGNVDAAIARATHDINTRQPDRLVKAVLKHSAPSDVTAVCGISYKPYTAFTEESQALMLVQTLVEKQHAVVVWDPLAATTLTTQVSELSQAVKQAQVIVLATVLPEITQFDWHQATAGKVIIDCWRQLNAEKYPHLTFKYLGKAD